MKKANVIDMNEAAVWDIQYSGLTTSRYPQYGRFIDVFTYQIATKFGTSTDFHLERSEMLVTTQQAVERLQHCLSIRPDWKNNFEFLSSFLSISSPSSSFVSASSSSPSSFSSLSSSLYSSSLSSLLYSSPSSSSSSSQSSSSSSSLSSSSSSFSSTSSPCNDKKKKIYVHQPETYMNAEFHFKLGDYIYVRTHLSFTKFEKVKIVDICDNNNILIQHKDWATPEKLDLQNHEYWCRTDPSV